MKKYIILALVIIFGTSILSAYMTYKSTNGLESNTKSVSEQIAIEENNSDKIETIVTSEEVVVAEDTVKVVEKKEEIVQEKNNTNEIKNIEEPKKTEEVKVKTETKEQPKKVEENTFKVQKPEKVETKSTENKEETITESYTEVKVEIAKKKECEGNNHGMNVGNTGMWFNTKDEAISTYKAEIKKWGDLWTDKDNPISNEEYYKNCPYGYEIWSCPYCGKWTLNYYLDN